MTVFALVICLCLCFVHAFWDGHVNKKEMQRETTSNYIVVIDAGSTGTRAQVFHYHSRSVSLDHFPFVDQTPGSLPIKLAFFKARPGISAFTNQTDGIPNLLRPLLNASANALYLHKTNIDLSKVPVYLGATAGMRTLSQDDRDRVMSAVRSFLRSESNPFAFAYDEQARVLAGEEEGAFGWLALNRHHLFSADGNVTHGAIDVGGGSAQITFIPRDTSILAGIFPMHFAGDKGPIHLYTHSFLRFGHVEAFQRATEILSSKTGNYSAVVEHPCLPHGLSWKVNPGEWGTSTSIERAERLHGPVQLRGTGNFSECRTLAKQLIEEAGCFLPPCSMLGVYQPVLDDSRFVILGRADLFRSWEVTVLVQSGTPLLRALEKQLDRICSLPLYTSVELFGGKGLLAGHGEPPCWLGTWLLTLLTDGLQFPLDSHNLKTIDGCCDGVLGHAIYEVNFFPYRLKNSDYSGLSVAWDAHLKPPEFEKPLPGTAVMLMGIGALVGAASMLGIGLAMRRHATARKRHDYTLLASWRSEDTWMRY